MSVYNRPIGIIAITITLLLFGVLSLREMSLGLMPQGLKSDRIRITLRGDSMGVEEALDKITRPAEQILSQIAGVANVDSMTRAWMVRLTVEVKDGKDISEVLGEISQSFDDQLYRFPSSMRRPVVDVGGVDDLPMMEISLFALDMDKETFEDRLKRQVFPFLESLKGVSRIHHELWDGGEMQIVPDKNQLEASKVSSSDVMKQLRGSKVSTEIIRYKNSKDRLERVQLRWDIPDLRFDQLMSLPVSKSHQLGDVAHLKEALNEDFNSTLVNGKPGQKVSIFRSADANEYEVSGRVITELEKMCPKWGLEMNVLFSTHFLMDSALDELASSAYWGLGLAFFFLMVFLRRWRLTLLIGITLPLSMAFALMALTSMGDQVNLLTMMGFILAVGMVIDNGIVVGEVLLKINRSVRSFSHWTEMVSKAVKNIAMPIVVSTLTTLSIFLPVVFMDAQSPIKMLLTSMGKPVAFGLLASLVLALLVLPMGFLYFHPNGVVQRARWVVLEWLEMRYKRALAFLLFRPLLSFLCCSIFLITGPFILVDKFKHEKNMVKKQDFDNRLLSLRVSFRDYLSPEDHIPTFKQWTDRLMENKERLCIKNVSMSWNRYSGRLIITLWPQDPKGRTPEELEEEMVELLDPTLTTALAGHYTGDQGFRKRASKVSGDSSKKSKKKKVDQTYVKPARISLLMLGNNDQTLDENWAKLLGQLKNEDGFMENKLDLDEEEGDLEMKLLPEASVLGYTPSDFNASLSGYTRRQTVAQLEDDWRISYGASGGELISVDDFMGHVLTNEMGLARNVQSLITRGTGPRQKQIKRKNGLSFKTFSFKVTEESRADIVKRLPEIVQKSGLDWNSDVRMDWNDQDAANDMGEGMFTLAMTLVLIYLIMGVLYESFVAPFVVMMTVPLTVLSVIVWLIWADISLGPMVLLGLLFLAGVVVNNGIVLVDHLVKTVSLKKVSMRPRCLLMIASASGHRFAPVLLTSLTTIGGSLVMGLGEGRIAGIAIAEMGKTISIGLFGSTFFTLFVIPMVYIFLGRLTQGISFMKNKRLI
jgi:HAE1 family hydrophobic/amphiphilic exporter-1